MKYLFTSDTHFGSERALELSKRSFHSVDEMNEVMIRNINNAIENVRADGEYQDVILYHLGDFGDHQYLKCINCDVVLLMGNYEHNEEEKYTGNEKYSTYLKNEFGYKNVISKPSSVIQVSNNDYRIEKNDSDKSIYHNIHLVHEPSNAKQIALKRNIPTPNDIVLFGHIHGRQKIKKIGIDVGVDANHFCPYTLDDIAFYHNAILYHYDNEVFFDM